MVAYSFKAQFEGQIVDLSKRQTVRGYRKRHARPGEPLQLYIAMRTRHCRKLLTPDPICTGLQNIIIAPCSLGHLMIETEGRMLDREEIEEFAVADGFGTKDRDGDAARRMAEFWATNHGLSAFGGVVIKWKPA